MQVTIVGVDCATDEKKVGLALGEWAHGTARVRQAETGGHGTPVAERVAGWISSTGPTLLALDAPLGWPAALGSALSDHRAGQALHQAPNDMFRRHTDRVVQEQIGRRPLDVGADRIARTAHAALTLLQALRTLTGQPIPLAWHAPPETPVSAIEVYPAGTLSAYGLRASGYKRKAQRAERQAMVDGLRAHLALPEDVSPLLDNADALDAAVCVLAGADFVTGQVLQPTGRARTEKEGWIWVHPKRERDT